MTELEKLCEQALYEEIRDLGDGKSIVRDVPTGRLFYKKELTVFNQQVYVYLKDHKSRYVPRIDSVRADGDKLIVVEEYIQGRTLENLLEDETEPLSFGERIRILTELCDGITFLHKAQPPIIHRDLKASNVMLTEDGVVKIIDYDAAKIYVRGEKKDTVLMGTHGVAAPEQYGFAASDVRTDIFALGKLLERMLPQNADAARIVAKATHIDPKKRYASASQIREQIVRIREHPSTLDTRLEKVVAGYDPGRKGHRTAARVLIVLLCMAILGGAGFMIWRFGIYPERRREELYTQLEAVQAGEATGDIADYVDHFLAEFPYEKMTEEEQDYFTDAVETALVGFKENDKRIEQVMQILSDRIGDEKTVETIRRMVDVERILKSGEYGEAFEKLRPLRESGSEEAEEKWKDAVRRCGEKAAAAEESLKKSRSLDDTKEAFEYYSYLFSDSDPEQDQEARESYDRIFTFMLDDADADSKSGEYDRAEKKYELLQDYHATETTAQTDMEERIRVNTYRKADSFFEEKEYKKAAELFRTLEDYRDAPSRISQCQYLIAESMMEKQEYSEAVKQYALCPGWEDADEKLREAQYKHCKSVAEKPDDESYEYIEDLVSSGYPGAEEIRNTMYQWHTEIKNGCNYSLGAQQSSQIRVFLYGGRPGASTHIKVSVTDNVEGNTESWTSPETCSRGGYIDATYNSNNGLEYSIFEREYTIRVYSDEGEQIGIWTGVFSLEFLKD